MMQQLVIIQSQLILSTVHPNHTTSHPHPHPILNHSVSYEKTNFLEYEQLEVWANAQRDGRPAEYRWRPLFNAAKRPCSNAAKTQNQWKFAGVPQTGKPISAASRPKFTILWGHVEEILLLNKFFSDCRYMPYTCEDSARQSCAMMPIWRFFALFLRPVFPASHAQHISYTCILNSH